MRGRATEITARWNGTMELHDGFSAEEGDDDAHTPATTNHRRQTQSPRGLSPGNAPRGKYAAPPAEAPRNTRGGKAGQIAVSSR